MCTDPQAEFYDILHSLWSKEVFKIVEARTYTRSTPVLTGKQYEAGHHNFQHSLYQNTDRISNLFASINFGYIQRRPQFFKINLGVPNRTPRGYSHRLLTAQSGSRSDAQWGYGALACNLRWTSRLWNRTAQVSSPKTRWYHISSFQIGTTTLIFQSVGMSQCSE